VADIVERRSALAEVYATGVFGADVSGNPGVILAERRPLSIVHVAGKSGDAAFASGVKKACGCDLPLDGGTVATAGDLSIIWLAPTRWLVVAPDRGAGVLEASLRDACGDGGAIIDVSHGRTVIRISGAHARTVLMKGAPLDFHSKVFTPGSCATSTISQCGVVLSCVDENTIDLYVFRAFGQHMWEWVCEAAGEFGYKVSETTSG
jgi:heterotetrameric sarcosine oxidase gamma subunit